jgi:hypothetical protein
MDNNSSRLSRLQDLTHSVFGGMGVYIYVSTTIKIRHTV